MHGGDLRQGYERAFEARWVSQGITSQRPPYSPSLRIRGFVVAQMHETVPEAEWRVIDWL